MNPPSVIDWVVRQGDCWRPGRAALLQPSGPQWLDAPDRTERIIAFATSGSSGAPKWIGLTTGALLTSAGVVNHHLGVGPDSCWGLALPWHHVGGFGVLARVWQSGCRLACLAGRWDPRQCVAWLADAGVSHVSMVPTQLYDVVSHMLPAPPRLIAVVIGGGKLEPALAETARSLGWPLLASYGMTEAASQIATQPLVDGKPYGDGSILPILPHWQVRTSEDQLLELSGPSLYAGVFVADGDHWRWQPRTETWYRTQDRVEWHPEGIIPLGRADARIKILGELVDPAAVESELLQLAGDWLTPGCFAVSAEAEGRSQHRLVLVLARALPAARIAALLERYHDQAPGFRRIHRILWIDALPVSPLGKLRRADLADWVATATQHPT